MLNSVAAGRRQAYRILIAQAIVAGLVALVFLVQGHRAALGALLGGGAVVLGSALMAWRAFGGGAAGAGATLLRLVGGLALKWFAIIAALWLALAQLHLPPWSVVAGMGAALVVSIVLGILSNKVVS